MTQQNLVRSVTAADFKAGVEAIVNAVMCAAYLVSAGMASVVIGRWGVVVFGALAFMAALMCFNSVHKIGSDVHSS